MIVYHFTSAEHGISNIENKRIKVSEIDTLNDPFELMAFNIKDKNLRHAFKKKKNEYAEAVGITCFSKDWDNPVQWAHYGDRYRGIALGFEIPNQLLVAVRYLKKRPLPKSEIKEGGKIGKDAIRKILATKFDHWRYEQEMRVFRDFSVEDRNHRSVGLPIFQDFSEELQLRKVILGAYLSNDDELKIRKALAAFGSGVELIKSRPAFGSFEVVEDLSWHTKNLNP